MKFSRALPLLPVAAAFVIIEPDVFERIEKTGQRLVEQGHKVVEKSKEVYDEVQGGIDDVIKKALEDIKSTGEYVFNQAHATGCHVKSWLEDSSFDHSSTLSHNSDHDHPDHPDHPPHHGPPHHQKPHDPDHKEPELTIYEMISKSNYTTKLANIIDEYPDLVKTLNGTKANYTIFAPIDSAFEKIPHHGKTPSKEDIEKMLLHHVSSDFYPAGRVLSSYTIPTLYKPEQLGHNQRLTVRVTVKGPTINFYSRIVAVNIFATNGVIHAVDSLLIPPPKVASIIDLLPGEFSTLELGLGKTGLFEKMNSTDYPHSGGTFFAPSNFAFQKLGPKINAFLFSRYGLKYLKALLEYHIVVDQTLYSDAFFDASHQDGESARRPPYSHFDLPTLLDDKYLAVDRARYGPFVEIRINGFSRVTVHDGVASDGVIQVVSDVLIPPKKENGEAAKEDFWHGEDMSVEEFKARLAPLIDESIEL